MDSREKMLIDHNAQLQSALSDRDKLIDDMVKWIYDADFWSAAGRFQARVEAMRSK